HAHCNEISRREQKVPVASHVGKEIPFADAIQTHIEHELVRRIRACARGQLQRWRRSRKTAGVGGLLRADGV
ncbi:MAG: hypothetical protein M3Q00_01075, partial [Pseudomonadota bacterium]|nr:hypothetical protein [Pseudomonadota bacterium]